MTKLTWFSDSKVIFAMMQLLADCGSVNNVDSTCLSILDVSYDSSCIDCFEDTSFETGIKQELGVETWELIVVVEVEITRQVAVGHLWCQDVGAVK